MEARVEPELSRAWKDFPGEIKSLTPRLLQTDLLVSRPFGDWSKDAAALRLRDLKTG